MSEDTNKELENQTNESQTETNQTKENQTEIINQENKENEVEKNKEVQPETAKKKKVRTRTKLVFIAIIIFAIVMFVMGRANYIKIMEIGENYLDVLAKNVKYQAYIGITNFAFIFILVCITNGFIKKGLKKFFEEEKKEIPHLPNKSLALVFALIAAFVTPNIFLEKLILFKNVAQFGIADPIFNMDIGFYMFQAPFIGLILYYLLTITIILTAYVGIYYIAVFNIYFDGIDGKTLKSNTFIKHLLFNVMIIATLISLIIIFNMQNIVLDRFLNLNGEMEVSIVGAGLIESTIKLWGYRILAVIIFISVFMAIRYFKKEDSKKVIKSLAVVPIYMVILFVVTVGYNMIFINGSELDKEKSYINTNIEFTKTAYNINIDETNLEDAKTITKKETEKNKNVIDNISIATEDIILNNLLQTQTSTGYYTYNTVKAMYYNDQLVYIAPRELNTENTEYNSKAEGYTHGYGVVTASASKIDEAGNLVYISKDFENKEIKEPRIYYGTETNSTMIISKDTEEFDYPKTTTENATYKYEGEGGTYLNLLDRVVLALDEKNPNIAFANSNDKILLNRNITERAKEIMPYLLYDEAPYLVIGDDQNLYWVLDAYTVSNQYPYSQRTKITNQENVQELNYIRNSVKVIVNAFNGDIDFYITDKTDPIIMVYNNMYNTMFKQAEEIPEGISKYFTYPEFLYNIQADILTMYHDVAADVLYRENDIWQIASYSNSTATTASTKMSPLLTMVKTVNSEKSQLGLVLAYNLYEKESLNAYLVGTAQNGVNTLSLYKYQNDSSIVGPIQLNNLLEQDETISSAITSLNATGTKITKEIVMVPLNNNLLYVVPIYQTSLNEKESVPILKKIIVASGNKVAIGNDLDEALNNLLSSNETVSIEVEDTTTKEGLVEAIIKANNNLNESSAANDWEQIGKDLKELQTLIKELEDIVQREENEQNEDSNNILQDTNNVNNIYTTNTIN